MPIELSVRLAFPVLTSRSGTGELELEFTGCGGNVYLDGRAVKKGPFRAVPVRGMTAGLVRVLSVMVSVPVCVPVADGVNLTVIVQLAPGWTVPQLFVAAKAPLAVAPVIENGTLVPLLTVTIGAGLVVPTPWLPKFSEAGEIDANGVLNITPTLPSKPSEATSGTPS